MKNNFKILTVILGITNVLVLLVILDKVVYQDTKPFFLIVVWIISVLGNIYYFKKIKKKGNSFK